MKKIALLILILITTLSCKNKTDKPISEKEPLTLPEMIAFAHGMEHWEQVEELKFTFNVDRGENHSERSWSWKPKTDDVTLYSSDDTIQYNRKNLDSLSLPADRAFINDKYWLLAPFNLVWDEGTSFTQKDSVTAPISNKTMQQLTITYGDEGGYTPGDAYDFFFENDFMIKEWIFRKGNDTVPSVITTWEDYKDFNGIKIATMHQNPEGTFKLYFTNIEVITANE
ncbi:MAG: hypothetical protein WDZ45_03955 [Flavobacteriaceae bacterium]